MNRKARIALLSANSLCHNPRVMKEAAALVRAGHDVSVLGAWHDPSFKARDLRLIASAPFQFISVLDATLPGLRSNAAQFIRRVGRRAADGAYKLASLQTPRQLGSGIGRLQAQALRIDADLYIAHSEPALHVAHALLGRGRRVGVDMEDWFSEDLLPEARRSRPLRLLRDLELGVLRRSAFASCPSRAMSSALAAEFECSPPTVVYNAFAWSDRAAIDTATKDRRDPELPSVHWFSTTLGPGRGLEDLLAALPLLKHDAEIHLRGNPVPAFERWMWTQIPDRWRDRTFIHPLVENEELLSRIAEHDVGFAGEMTYCRSRDLTVTNKILHYLLGGLAVVASDTQGQREIAAAAPDAVRLYRRGDAHALADALDELLGSPERLRNARAAALSAAEKTFCWERQEPALIDAVAHALARPAAAI
jgi:glycosyltransferase involved in cell wall biosynthesis